MVVRTNNLLQPRGLDRWNNIRNIPPVVLRLRILGGIIEGTMGSLRNRVLNTLVGRICPVVYIIALRSLMLGFEYTFLTKFSDVQNSIIYHYAIGGATAWGPLMLVGATALIIGMMTKKKHVVSTSAMIIFMMWVFAIIALVGHGAVIAAILIGLVDLMFYGYVYLAASFNVLWDSDGSVVDRRKQPL